MSGYNPDGFDFEFDYEEENDYDVDKDGDAYNEPTDEECKDFFVRFLMLQL